MRKLRSFKLAIIASLITIAGSAAPAAAQPAPPLTSLRVEAVASTKSPAWDYVQGAFATNRDHGGPVLVVVTRELGYTQNNRIAKFNGVRLSEDRPAQRILGPGNVIVGYYRYWRYTGNFVSGTFTYQATSQRFPFNTLSTRVSIR